MMTGKMQDALNSQINAEFYSSYLYLSMAAHCESLSLKGAGHWMRCQAQEELIHSLKLYQFVNDRLGRVTLKAIDGPPTEWDSLLAVFTHVAEHEAKVTGLINGLVDVAIAEKDHASRSFLQWFVDEQVEEEASADEVVQKLKLVGDDRASLLMLDQELGRRLPPFVIPLTPAEAAGA